MRWDGEDIFWNLAGLAGLITIAVISVQILRYGLLAARDLWQAWKRRP